MINNIELIGYISFPKNIDIKFKNKFEYEGSKDINVDIKSENKSLIVKFLLQDEDIIEAKKKVEKELIRLSNYISWILEVPIQNFGITEYLKIKNLNGGKDLLVSERPIIVERISMYKEFDDQKAEEIINMLEEDENEFRNNIFHMWREAISINSEALRFLLLYRILEKLHNDSRRRVDEWIESKLTNVEYRISNGQNVTIYTYLRDNIHPKSTIFPFTEIKQYVEPLKNLVRDAVNDQS